MFALVVDSSLTRSAADLMSLALFLDTFPTARELGCVSL